MTEFYFPERFDNNIADEGVWFEVEDENGNLWGRFRCALVDQSLPRYQAAIERLERKYTAAAKRNKKVKATHTTAEILVECSLLDWEVKGANGELIPFSKSAALSYFTSPQALYVLRRLLPMVEDITNFQSEEQDEAGDPLGNSSEDSNGTSSKATRSKS